MEFHAYDLDHDGYLDYVEWTVPHLSTQTFEIIFISKALELDADKNPVADIYDQVQAKDGTYATVPAGQFVRATFKQILTDKNDITLYAKPTDPAHPTTIEVYDDTTDQLVTTFPAISQGDYYKVLLTNLQNPSDVFDLKVTGGSADIDYIVDPTGWLTGWAHRKKVTISNTNVNSDLTDFPALIKFTADSDLSAALQSGADIRFTDAGGSTLLKYERESWTGGGGSAATGIFWVKVPTVSSSANTDLYVYYGNAGASDGQDAANVWTNGYAGVWHLNDAGNPTIADSTSNGNTGTNTGVTSTTGPFGAGAGSFDGVSSYVGGSDSALPSGSSPRTFSLWFKTASATNGELFDYGTTGNNQLAAIYLQSTGQLAAGLYNAGDMFNSGPSFKDGQWHFATYIYDGSTEKYYGDLGLIGSMSTTPATSLSRFEAGRFSWVGSYYYTGSIGEIRVSSLARSADWINFEYHNQADAGQDITLANQENSLTWLSGWNNRQKITIDHTKVGLGTEDETDFPVLVSIPGLTGPLANGADIRFTADDGGTYLAREIESFAPVLGTGGTITTDGDYTVHTFTSDGTFTPPPGVSSVEVLAVAGGGSGGSGTDSGGGGGGGGVIHNSSYSISGSVSVTVGSGGGQQTFGLGNNGNNSVFDSITAHGGGGGANGNLGAQGNSGGSGGGGAVNEGRSAGRLGGAGIAGEGHDGGMGNGAEGYPYASGGGGGAGTAGANAASTGGNGGDGMQSSISGSPVYYGGGGGGGAWSPSATAGTGGLGGGGNGGHGGDINSGANGSAASANTGGGGGGGGDRGYGGAGGSGVVIVRYRTPVSKTLTAWVKVPHLSHTADTVIYMYFGNASATEPAPSSTYGSQNVWTNGYAGVWHLNDAANSTIHDSTANNNTGTNNGVISATGPFGAGAGSFDGDGLYAGTGYITLPNLPVSGNVPFTISSQFKTSHGATNYYEELFSLNGFEFLFNYPIGNNLGIYPNTASGTASPSLDVWHQAVAVYDGIDTTRVYVDGAIDFTKSGTVNTNGATVDLGASGPQGNWYKWNGALAESRFSTVTRSAGWISTEYQNQNAPATFATLGNVEGTAINQNYLTGWAGRKKITISHANVDEDLSNFPLLVRFSGEHDLAGALSSGNDIRFTASDGTTILPYEKETWSGGGGSSASGVFWVKVPTISHTADTDIYVYYGNSGASDGEQKTAVWDSNYKGVWHLNDPTNPTDSTSNGNDGTNHGVTSAAGPFGAGAGSFHGSVGGDTYISLGAAMPLQYQYGTYSVWINPGTQSTYTGIFDQDGSNGTFQFLLTPANVPVYSQAFTGQDFANNAALTTDAWQLLTVSRDPSNIVQFYLNGVPTASGTDSAVMSFADAYIGKLRAYNNFNGLLSEFRASNSTRDAAWIKFEYQNQSSANNQLSIEGYTATTPGQIVWTDGSGDGKWSTAGNWQGGVVPGTSDTAVFNSSASGNCSIDTAANVRGIQIASGYTGTITQSGSNTLTLGSAGFSQAGGTFAGGTGAITDAGDFSETAGAFTSTSGALSVAGAFTHSGGTWAANSGTVLLANTSDKALNISASTPFANLNLNDGLVGYWKMDETSGALVHDASGYGNDGTNHGATISGTTAPTHFANAKSLSFDGVTNYVDVGNDASINPTSAITVSTWINGPAASPFQTIVSKEGLKGYQLGTYNNNVYFAVKTANNGWIGTPATSGQFNPNAWNHVLGIYDGSNIKLYVNGVLVPSQTTSATGNIVYGSSYTAVGIIATDLGSPFAGKIDDVRIYNRALSSGEIAALAAGNEPGTSVATTTVTGGNLSVTGDLTLNSGTLDTGTRDISVAGNWQNNGGIFAPNSQTVTLAGTDQSINSSNSFYNLAKSVSSAAVLTFGAGSTQTVAHTLSLSGAAGNLLSLRSSADGTQWKINPQGTRTLSYLDVKDSNNTNGTAIATAGQNITDSGNNINWTFDTTPPVVTVTSPANSSVSGTSVNFSASATDETALGFLVPDLDSSLVSWWKGDVTGGTTVADSIGSNTGTVHGGVTEVAGKFGKAMSFNGTDGNLSLGTSLSQSFSEITVSTWVKTSPSGWQSVIERNTWNDPDGFGLFMNYGRASFGQYPNYVTSSVNVSDNQWHNIVGQLKNATWYIYVDGVLDGTMSGPTSIASSSVSPNIGSRLGTGLFYNGFIDDTMIFNRALTADEVLALYNGTAISHTSTLSGGSHTYKAYAEDLAGNVGSSATSTFSVDTVAPSTSDNFYSGWSYKKQITIDHAKVGSGTEDETDFPVLVSLTGLSNINANGTDIRFALADGTPLAREIESYSGGNLTAWVKIPTLSHTADTVIEMYYGNSGASEPAASSTYGSQSVWTNGYAGVWHLNDAGNATIHDSTANGNTGTNSGVTETSGPNVLGAGNFNGTNNITVSNSNSLLFGTGDFSYSVWAKTSSDGNNQILTKSTVNGTGYNLWFRSGGKIWYQHSYNDLIIQANFNYADGNWHNYAIRRQSGVAYLYIDGVYAGQGNDTSDITNTTNLVFGAQNYSGISGAESDIRISSAARSAAWIATEYQNQNAPSSFISSGAPVAIGGWQTASQTITLTPSDQAPSSGIASTKYCTDTNNTCDPSSGTTLNSPYQVTISTEGISYLRYQSTDVAGNVQPVVSLQVKIDTTAPTTSADGNGYTFGDESATDVSVALSCSDGSGSGCATTLYCTDTDNSCVPATTYSTAIPFSTAGTTYLRYSSSDTAGNAEGVKSSTVTINKTLGWLSGWNFRKKITIDHTNVGSTDLANFPLLVKLSGDADLAQAQASGHDIRFTQSNGTSLLKYEREAWTGGAGTAATSTFWVKIPTISHTADTDIYAYYGNSGATDGQDAANVWTNGYAGVWHLNQTGTNPQVLDSTSNANNSTSQTWTPIVNGEIGGAASFNGVNEKIIETGASNLPTGATVPYTFSVWLKPTALANGTLIATIGNPLGANGGVRGLFVHPFSGGPQQIAIWGTNADVVTGTNFDIGSWQEITFSADASTLNVYKNNSLIYSGARPANTNATNILTFSNAYPQFGWSKYYNGLLDETRISSTARSSDWIKFEYQNETGNNELSFSTRESDDVTAPDTSDNYGAKDNVWQNSAQTITLTPHDNATGVAWTKYCTDHDNTCLIDAAHGTDYGAPVTIAASSSAETTYFRYASADNAGNVQTTVSRIVKIDATTPVISNIAPVSGSNLATGDAITFTTNKTSSCRIALSDVALSYDSMASSTICSVTNGIQMSCIAPELGAPGTKNIYLACQDYLGNKDATSTATHLSYVVPAAPAPAQSGGGGGGFFPGQSGPSGTFGISVDGGAGSVSSRKVSLGLSAAPGSGTTAVILSSNPDFSEGVTIPYSSSVAFDLCAESKACPDGQYSVYAKFLNAQGFASSAVSARVTLDTMPLATSIANAAKGAAGALAGKASDIVSAFFPPASESPAAPSFPPIEQSVPDHTPLAFRGKWKIVSPSGVQDLAFADLPASVKDIARKFPDVGAVLQKVGVRSMNGATRLSSLSSASISLPGLAESLGKVPSSGISVASLSGAEGKKLPTDIVFARTADEKIDLNAKLSIGTGGLALQTLNTIQGQTLKFVIRPEGTAKKILGYLIFKSAKTNAVSRGKAPALSASLADAVTGISASSVSASDAPDLVLSQFEYKDSGNGIWTADVPAPQVLGQYELRTVVNYAAAKKAPKQISMVVVVDPEGYVYKKAADGEETRIAGATVSIFWLNPATKAYELWPAKDFRQENPQTTDVTGRYAFLVPPGTYYLAAAGPGAGGSGAGATSGASGSYEDFKSDSFTVEASRGVFMNIELKEKWSLGSVLGGNAFSLQNVLLGGIAVLLGGIFVMQVRSRRGGSVGRKSILN